MKIFEEWLNESSGLTLTQKEVETTFKSLMKKVFHKDEVEISGTLYKISLRLKQQYENSYFVEVYLKPKGKKKATGGTLFDGTIMLIDDDVKKPTDKAYIALKFSYTNKKDIYDESTFHKQIVDAFESLCKSKYFKLEDKKINTHYQSIYLLAKEI
jgi:hypothetical protein